MTRDGVGRRSRTLILVEAALWLVATVAGGSFAWWVADSALYQERAAATLERAGTELVNAAEEAPLATGSPLGRISIPRLGLTAVVAEGVDDETLRRAVGHLPRSARPGKSGNVVLAGHRDTFFRSLEEIRAGDVVQLDSGAGWTDYRVEWARVVEPRSLEVIDETGYPALTLVTCYPFRWVGPAPRRLVVRAREIEATGEPRSGA